MDYRKHRSDAPRGFFAAEAAGLAWLAETGEVSVVDVLDHGEDFLLLEWLETTPPTEAAAREFGAGLARLHDAGAPGFGWAPAPEAWFGPLEAPFEVPTTSRADFATFWAQDRLRPLAGRTSALLGEEAHAAVEAAIVAIDSGAYDGVCGDGREQPARVHGDLWAGNLLWTPRGATLIDPAAHGGHRLEDLALLSLFGAPHLEQIFTGYEAEHSMPEGWREDLPAHLFFALLAHVDLFGRGYVRQTLATARRVSARARAIGG